MNNFKTEDFLDDLLRNLEINTGMLNSNGIAAIDNQFEKFINIFQNTLNKHAPIRQKTKKREN